MPRAAVFALLLVTVPAFAQVHGDPLQDASLGAMGFAPWLPARIEEEVARALAEGQAPGAVVIVGREGRIVHASAHGRKIAASEAAAEPLTRDAVFDAASLTKPIAGATSIMKLVERDALRLGDPVARHLPGFGTRGKERITIEQLLRHRGGLIADNPIGDYEHGQDEARRRIFDLELVAEPGSTFLYTDVGFIVLGWVVEAVSGRSLDAFAAEEVFAPLGLRATGFAPLAAGLVPALASRVVPTEPAVKDGPALRGVVHDPRARRLGGVAGHAGLFTTADDVAHFAAMLLDEGRNAEGLPFLRPETVASMLGDGGLPPGERRGLGLDIDTRFSGPRGRHFPKESFGHTGFTGTSFWCDPATRTFLVLMTSRLHPKGAGDVRALRAALATVVAESLRDAPWPLAERPAPEGPVRCGIDRLAEGAWPPSLRGKRIGLVTNHTGRTRDGRRTIDVLRAAPEVTLVRLFSPEHGLAGTADEDVGHGQDAATGLPVFSLYGSTRRPEPAMLEGLDALVFDVQDVGCRFYTYMSTLVAVLEEAARAKLLACVLDRPNVIGADQVEGPVADRDALDFVGCLEIPVRHGLTAGELARLAVAMRGLDLRLEVVPVEGWRRTMRFEETGLPWIDTSPNMRSPAQALLYPGIGLLETTNLSVGRGTETPFEIVGAPWIDAARLAAALRAADLPGLAFEPTRFTPAASVHAGLPCAGLRFRVTDPAAFRPVRTGLALARALRAVHPTAWQMDRLPRLLKSARTFELLASGAPLDAIAATWEPALARYRAARRAALLYDR